MNILENLKDISKILEHPDKTEVAQNEFILLISKMTINEYKQFKEEIGKAIKLFYPKRKKTLEIEIAKKFSNFENQKPVIKSVIRKETIDKNVEAMKNVFFELSEHHIFQWGTFYRTAIFELFEKCCSFDQEFEGKSKINEMLLEVTRKHSKEIFNKGAEYQNSIRNDVNNTTKKALSGLQNFLELPIEAYTNTLIRKDDLAFIAIARNICSALLAGILIGFSDVNSNGMKGFQVLPRYPRSWLHYIGFITSKDFEKILEGIEVGDIKSNLTVNIIPFLKTVDHFSSSEKETGHCYPVSGQFDWNYRKYNISLQPFPKNEKSNKVDISIFIDTQFVDNIRIEEDVRRNVGLIIAPLRQNISDVINSKESIKKNVVNTIEKNANVINVINQIETTIRKIINDQNSKKDGHISYNYAKEFPLHDPFLSRYSHVYRKSVQDLLTSFERKNGIRLWCSIRRSGKTTACFDIKDTTGQYFVVSQTCDNTDQEEASSYFINDVKEKIKQRTMINDDYFMNIVSQCLPLKGNEDKRLIFLLDEYETLFELLRISGQDDEKIRFFLVQPLMNQIVKFSRENLVVLIGQRPDAHYIFMDKNQLSPYVEQDSFPLFIHEEGKYSEFNDFLTRVITDKFKYDYAFSSLLYSITQGHPFLTVNVLVIFFQWLIDENAVIKKMTISEEMFNKFIEKKLLQTKNLRSNQEFKFFRETISEALGSNSRERTPWLYSIYKCLKILSTSNPIGLSMNIKELKKAFDEIEIVENLGYHFEDFIGMGCRANFLKNTNDNVSPRIPILGHLCRETLPRVQGS